MGKLAKDQVEDYTLRKDQWLEVSERWLAIYNWAHRSVQDYFAAQFIYYDAKDEQKSILEKIYSSKNASSYSEAWFYSNGGAC